jgi:hypothetical protein
MSFWPARRQDTRCSREVDAQTAEETETGQEAAGDARAIAQAINRAGMGGLASIALEIVGPLHWIGGQAAWALEPILGAFGPFSRKGAMSIERIALLLERPDGVNELKGQLEETRGMGEDRGKEAGGRL